MKNMIFLILMCSCLVPWASAMEEKGQMSDLFPDMEGWTRDGRPEMYTPTTLFEYINGAAEVYLSYGFQELATLTYENTQDRSLTIDIYRHSHSNNGFGIYGQEKPLKSTFLSIGAEGYYEPGMLNFFKDRYYVKILSFGLGDEDSSFLKSVAGEIAEKISGEETLPVLSRVFPKKGKVENSERYIAQNFLGHSFLHSAFVAEYDVGGERMRPFVIEAADEEEAEAMLSAYLGLLEKNGIDFKREKGVYHFQDPYFDKTKTMSLKQTGNHIWGLFAGDPSAASSVLNAIENKLKEFKLIK